MGARASHTESLPDLVDRLDRGASAATKNADIDRRAGHPAAAAVYDQYASLLEESARTIRELRVIAGRQARATHP
jgi:hypothetical protein